MQSQLNDILPYKGSATSSHVKGNLQNFMVLFGSEDVLLLYPHGDGDFVLRSLGSCINCSVCTMTARCPCDSRLSIDKACVTSAARYFNGTIYY